MSIMQQQPAARFVLPNPEFALAATFADREERNRGLWRFITWSFFLSQIAIAEEFIGRAAAASELEDGKTDRSQAATEANAASLSAAAAGAATPEPDLAAEAASLRAMADPAVATGLAADEIDSSTVAAELAVLLSGLSGDSVGGGADAKAAASPMPTPDQAPDQTLPPGVIDVGGDSGHGVGIGIDLPVVGGIDIDLGQGVGVDLGLDLGGLLDVDLELGIALPGLVQDIASPVLDLTGSVLGTATGVVDSLLGTVDGILLADGAVLGGLDDGLGVALGLVDDVTGGLLPLLGSADPFSLAGGGLPIDVGAALGSTAGVVDVVDDVVSDATGLPLLQSATSLLGGVLSLASLDAGGSATASTSDPSVTTGGSLTFAAQQPATAADPLFHNGQYTQLRIAIEDDLSASSPMPAVDVSGSADLDLDVAAIAGSLNPISTDLTSIVSRLSDPLDDSAGRSLSDLLG